MSQETQKSVSSSSATHPTLHIEGAPKTDTASRFSNLFETELMLFVTTTLPGNVDFFDPE